MIRSTFISNGGSVVSGINLGDGLIGLFASLEQGIAAARRCARDAPSTGLHLHLGIDVGEIVVDEQRIYGTPVNFAARLCSLTGPDEILVSDRVRRAATTSPRSSSSIVALTG